MRLFLSTWFRLHREVPKKPSDMVDKDWIYDHGHEEHSKTRVREFQEMLDKFAGPIAKAVDLKALQDHLEIQLKIEELVLKSRMSEHVKVQAYGPFIIPLLAAVLGAIAGYLFKRGC